MRDVSRICMVLAAACCLAWFAAAGGGCVVTQSQDVHGKTMDVSDPITERNYYLYLPQSWNKDRGQRYPLIVSLHGMKPFDNAMPQLMSWKKICDEQAWICIAPQLKSPDMLNQFPFRYVDDAILNDEAQVLASVGDVIAKYNADPNNVLLTGWSSGGFLIHYMGARHPEMWSVVSAQGSNFSEDIMPEKLTEAARRTPIYIYHGANDFPGVVSDSNEAMQWYIRNGYSSVRMDEAPGGHERHPEFGARFFIGHMNGTNRYLASSSVEMAKRELRNQPWLGATSAGGAAAPGTPIASATTSPPGGRTPAAPAASTTNVSEPRYVWDKIGPRTASSGAPAAAPTPLDSQGNIERIETPGGRARPSGEPRPSGPSDTLVVAPTTPSTPTPVPIGPSNERPSSPTNVVPAPTSPVAVGRAPSDSSRRTSSGAPAPAAPNNLAPGHLPEVRGPRTGVASTDNPVAGMSPAASTTAAPTPVSSTPPQVVPVAPNRTGVRIVSTANEGTAPFTVEFRAEVRNIGSEVVRYRWRLDDILFSTSHHAVLTFQRPGQYPIELTIFDAAGNTYRDRVIVRVFAVEG